MKINPQLQSVLDKHFGKELSSLSDRVTVISSYKMDREDLKSVLGRFPELEGKEAENVVDPDLLGGFVIRFGSKLIDLSLMTQLQSLQQKLYEE